MQGEKNGKLSPGLPISQEMQANCQTMLGPRKVAWKLPRLGSRPPLRLIEGQPRRLGNYARENRDTQNR